MKTLAMGDDPANQVLEEIVRSRYRSSGEQRVIAIEILGQRGSNANSAQAAVLAALEDPDPHVRAVAAGTLSSIGVVAKDAVPALTAMLDGDQKRVAARALSEYRGDALIAQPQLILIMEDKSLDDETRWNAARTLGKIGPVGVDAVPNLVAALQDEIDTVREHAAEALGDIGPTAAAAVADLVAVLDDPAVRVRRDAVRSLGQIGPAARVAIPEMKALLEDPEAIVREAAETAIKTIAPDELPAKQGEQDEGE
jgi:HEAT repeat protein